jgi:hypothetical protein
MSITSMTEGPAVLIGYPWRLQLEAAAPVFAEGAAYAGQLRARASDPDVLTTITSDAGGVLRVSDTVLELALRADQTAGLAPGRVVLDLVRVDLDPDLHLGFFLEIPVMLPVTRGLAP